jgi:hypothetical protein
MVLVRVTTPTRSVRVRVDGRAGKDELRRVLVPVLVPFVEDELSTGSLNAFCHGSENADEQVSKEQGSQS